METPKDGQIPSMPDNFFNVTMTYNRQSMIYIPYGKVAKVKHFGSLTLTLIHPYFR